MSLATQDPPFSHLHASFFFFFFFDKLNYVKLNKFGLSLINFNRIWLELLIFKFYILFHMLYLY